MWPLATYSNYFKIVSTVTFVDSQSELIPGMFPFKTDYKIIMIMQSIIFAAPGF